MFSLINLYGTRSLLQKSCMPSSLFFDICHFNSRFPIFFYPFKYCCCLLLLLRTYPHYVCSFLRDVRSYFCRDFKNGIWRTTKVKFSRVLAFIDEGRPEILVRRTRSRTFLSSPPPRSSSHIFQNTLRWTRTEKKQTSNWIKTNVSLWKKLKKIDEKKKLRKLQF